MGRRQRHVHQRQAFYGAPWVAALIGAEGTSGCNVSQACSTATTCLYYAAAGVESGLFQDNAWVTRYALCFANLYRTALLAYEQGDVATKALYQAARQAGKGPSVVSTGQGFQKQLYVNGIVTTLLVPETKFMAHLPLALHDGKSNSVLIICFGMGTSYRSALSWNVKTTAVELVPIKSSCIFTVNPVTSPFVFSVTS